MRYIKLFENYSDLDDIYNDVESIFSYLRDYNYDIYVDKEEYGFPGEEEQAISFHIGKNNKNKNWLSTSGEAFLIEGQSEDVKELKDCILRLQDFLSDWYCHIEIGYNEKYKTYLGVIPKDIKLEDYKFSMKSNSELVDFPIVRLKVIFTRKIKKD